MELSKTLEKVKPTNFIGKNTYKYKCPIYKIAKPSTCRTTMFEYTDQKEENEAVEQVVWYIDLNTDITGKHWVKRNVCMFCEI